MYEINASELTAVVGGTCECCACCLSYKGYCFITMGQQEDEAACASACKTLTGWEKIFSNNHICSLLSPYIVEC